MIRWRIYYEKGTYSDQDGPLEDAPGEGVQAIIESDDTVGRIIHSGTDWYWYSLEYNQWVGGDSDGMKDYLRQPGLKKVLQGRALPKDIWLKIYNQALHDTDFPRKSAWLRHERRPKEVKSL